MPQKTGIITVDGTEALMPLLIAAGYIGRNNGTDQLTLYPANPAETFYINLNDSTLPPVDGTEGLQIGAGGIADSFDFARAEGGERLDAGTTFLHTTTEIDIKFAVIGG
jgi:hypothetical protein